MSRYEHRRPFERTKGGDGWSHGVSIRSGRNNAGSRLDRHGGRWLMTLPQTPEQISTPKDSSLFFHLRDTELLVTEFPGCGTRFFLPITTCHATLSLSLFPVSRFSSPSSPAAFFPFSFLSIPTREWFANRLRASPPADPMHEKPTPRVNSDLLFLSPRERERERDSFSRSSGFLDERSYFLCQKPRY